MPLVRTLPLVLCLLPAMALSTIARGAELVTLNAETWDKQVVAGKEVDCIYGDLVLRNDKIVAVIARPIAGRNANMTTKNAGGGIIDLTFVDRQNDQLTAYYPGGKKTDWRTVVIDEPKGTDPAKANVKAASISVRCTAAAADDAPAVEVRYTLADGWDYVLVETTFKNTGDKPIETSLVDEIRADGSFEKMPSGKAPLYWVYDKWWGQAYGVLNMDKDPAPLKIESGGATIRYANGDSDDAKLAAGQSRSWKRALFPAASHWQLRQIADRLRGVKQKYGSLTVKDTSGKPVPEADLQIVEGEKKYAKARTDERGRVEFDLPEGEFTARVSAAAYGEGEVKLAAGEQTLELPEPGYVVATITNEQGGPTPAKVQFRGQEGTDDPYFFYQTGEHAVQNLYYTHNGRFRQAIAPGKYQAIVSYGTEHDAVFRDIEVRRGQETKLEAALVRSVQTPGWISADFHSHSSPSGDNTSSQLGRVLNLLCEHIEYAPCTEHNRLSTYVPHLRRLGVEKLMGTCVGIELTDQPGDVNHHNAFPLIPHEHVQDNGAPLSDSDVELKVERLALWDNNSEKLVQQNHPDIGHVFYDRNKDGQPDGGFKKLLPYLDCIEVHPPHTILKTAGKNGRSGANRIFNWLQLLNQGYRIPGVVNTDAHYNFHGSGSLRIYVESPTDNPAEVKTLDIVHAVEHGHVVMTTGPFMEVLLQGAKDSAKLRGGPGDDLAIADGKAVLNVRVQCPNWFDIDRVQVLLNGRMVETLNFTREKTPERFTGGVVKFDQQIPLELDGDTHVIVVAAGERSTLGSVFGPTFGKGMPVAVSNPIYVDVDGGGFKANGDTLGAPLPGHEAVK